MDPGDVRPTGAETVSLEKSETHATASRPIDHKQYRNRHTETLFRLISRITIASPPCRKKAGSHKTSPMDVMDVDLLSETALQELAESPETPLIGKQKTGEDPKRRSSPGKMQSWVGRFACC